MKNLKLNIKKSVNKKKTTPKKFCCRNFFTIFFVCFKIKTCKNSFHMKICFNVTVFET